MPDREGRPDHPKDSPKDSSSSDKDDPLIVTFIRDRIKEWEPYVLFWQRGKKGKAQGEYCYSGVRVYYGDKPERTPASMQQDLASALRRSSRDDEDIIIEAGESRGVDNLLLPGDETSKLKKLEGGLQFIELPGRFSVVDIMHGLIRKKQVDRGDDIPSTALLLVRRETSADYVATLAPPLAFSTSRKDCDVSAKHYAAALLAAVSFAVIEFAVLQNPGMGADCSASHECGRGFSCSGNKCAAAACTKNDDCAAHMRCSGDGQCEQPSFTSVDRLFAYLVLSVSCIALLNIVACKRLFSDRTTGESTLAHAISASRAAA